MPNQNDISFYIKNETGIPLNNGSPNNYTGFGTKINSKVGSFEIMPAVKFSDKAKSGFAEFRYTTPKISNSNFSFESRARYIVDVSNNNVNHSFTERIAGKYSANFGKFNIYEVAGSSLKITPEKGLNSIIPTFISGVGYNLKKNLSSYVEMEVTKPYNNIDKSWQKPNFGAYFGLKVSF